MVFKAFVCENSEKVSKPFILNSLLIFSEIPVYF